MPPASAGPSTAAITGLVRSRIVNPANPPRSVWIDAPPPAATTFRSAPAQKTGGTPVIMASHTSSSPSTRSMAASIPSATSAFTALRASGRLMVMTARWSSTRYSMAGIAAMRSTTGVDRGRGRWPPG